MEEAYETIDAIEHGSTSDVAEELGDLLLQVVLQAQIFGEQAHFSLTEIATGITQKLIRRHPHVFGETTVNSTDEVHANWERIKAEEAQKQAQTNGGGTKASSHHHLSQKLHKYARSLPPLMGSLKSSQKAAAAGLEWESMDGVWAKFYEEVAEFQEALLSGNPEHQTAELGDVLFTLVNIARWCDIDPSTALRATNTKLIDRIRLIEASATKPLEEHSLEELEELWQKAKAKLDQPQQSLLPKL